MAAFKFRVYTVDGDDLDDLDDYSSSEPNWQPGDELYVNGVPAYRIRTVIPIADLGNEIYQGIWEVEPV